MGNRVDGKSNFPFLHFLSFLLDYLLPKEKNIFQYFIYLFIGKSSPLERCFEPYSKSLESLLFCSVRFEFLGQVFLFLFGTHSLFFFFCLCFCSSSLFARQNLRFIPMASKFGLAGGIPERKVRPIWDAIDSRQFKNALKHVSTLLAKHPNSPYALVRTLICTLITFVDIEFALFFLCC